MQKALGKRKGEEETTSGGEVRHPSLTAFHALPTKRTLCWMQQNSHQIHELLTWADTSSQHLRGTGSHKQHASWGTGFPCPTG